MDYITERQSLFAVTAVVFTVSYVVYQRFFSPLACVPGPFMASITSFWLAYHYRRQDWHKYAIELHQQYGPVVRVAPNTVDVGDPDAVRVIYGRCILQSPSGQHQEVTNVSSGAGSKFWKGKWYCMSHTLLLCAKSPF
jgi:hypothetical protein